MTWMDKQRQAVDIAAGSPLTRWLEAVPAGAPKNEIETAACGDSTGVAGSGCDQFDQRQILPGFDDTTQSVFGRARGRWKDYFPDAVRKELGANRRTSLQL